jgi:hypothetical protein
MAATAAGPDVRSFVTEIGYPPADNEPLHRLFRPMPEPEPLPEPEPGGRGVTVTPSPVKHPARGFALESTPRAGLVSPQEPGGFPR